MNAWTQEQKKKATEQEEINRLRIEAAKKEAVLNRTGEITEDLSTLQAPVHVPTLTQTDVGAFGQRANWIYEIVDFKLLPHEYWIPDHAQLQAIAKAHHDKKQVPGVIFKNVPTSQLRRK